MAKHIAKIEGIGPTYAEVLLGADIKTTDELLEAGATRHGREQLSARTGISERTLLKWVNMCDLFRIKGVASQFAELLEAAGVDTVKELRHRNSENLTEALERVNLEKNLVRQTPVQKTVNKWIQQAQQLPPVISH